MNPVPRMAMPEPSDRELIDRILTGDRPALDLLMLRHHAVAYRVACRLLRCEADALDAVQDGFVNVLSHLGRFRGQCSFRTWLLRIVSNAALDIGRSKQRRDSRFSAPAEEFHETFDPRSTPLDHGLERADLRDKLDDALAALPAVQRQTFVLHVDGDLSYREVAEVLGISIGTVMSRLFYARQRLREALLHHVQL